ncbi:MAG: hypothetical protein H6739_10565 [Alphaproteobacteria bacterium]|nr:hypothetical protein [Alphaproteobacteria bacterium]
MSIDRNLVFYRAGLLDPAQTIEFEEQLAASPELRERLEALDARWTPEVDVETPNWRIPPPGLGVGASAGLPEVFSESTLRPGDRFQIRIDPLPTPERRQIVILRRQTRSWEVVYPTRPDQAATLKDLSRDEDGSYRLDLSAQTPGGRQRWAVALPWVDSLVDWSRSEAERWDRLQEAVSTGQIPVASVEIDVEEALAAG